MVSDIEQEALGIKLLCYVAFTMQQDVHGPGDIWIEQS
jgi:hypothetical protein